MITEPRAEQGSPEWLAARHRDHHGRARITASVSAAMFGEHEFLSDADLAVQQLQDEPPSEEMTEEMERGHELEPVILDHWGRKHNVEVLRPAVMHVRGRFLANLDGLARKEPVEAKSTTHRFSPTAFGHRPFRYWMWQGVTQAYCYYGEPGVVHWSIFDGDMRFKEYDQEVTQEEIDRLVEAGDEWLSYIDLGMPPIGVELSDKHVADLNRGATGAVELPPDGLFWVRQLREGRQEAADAEKKITRARIWLAQNLAGNDVGLFHGEPIVTWREQAGRKGFDRAGFAADHPDLAEKYTTVGQPFRVMLTKGEANGVDA